MQTKPKMATEIPASITTPDRVETRLGTLRFFDGLPDEQTVQTVYDNLDFQRGVQAFLTAMPAASRSRDAHRHPNLRARQPDGAHHRVAGGLSLALPHRQHRDRLQRPLARHQGGPLVIEVPPHVLGFIDDFWYRYVTDVGNVGPGQGQGGKYLLLPPDYNGDVPDGYYVLHSRTYGNWMFFRGFIEDGDLRPAVESAKGHLRVYPLDQAANPPAMNFVNISGAVFNTIHANDASFFDEVAAVVQEEPLEAADPETRGLLAAIGIRKGKPFAPDARMQASWPRPRPSATRPRAPSSSARATRMPTTTRTAPGRCGGSATTTSSRRRRPRCRWADPLLLRGHWKQPGWSRKMVGKSSQYAFATQDADGQYLDGAKTYRLHLPAAIPVKDFWSIVVYDPQTRSMLQTDQQFPSLSSQKEGLTVNPDTLGGRLLRPNTSRTGKEANWVQTIPGKGWWVVLRLYGPLEPWFDQTWRPGRSS